LPAGLAKASPPLMFTVVFLVRGNMSPLPVYAAKRGATIWLPLSSTLKSRNACFLMGGVSSSSVFLPCDLKKGDNAAYSNKKEQVTDNKVFFCYLLLAFYYRYR